MKLRIGLFVMITAALGFLFQNGNAEAVAPQLAAKQREAILSSTLQIAMFEHAAKEGAPESGERGLGTVVSYGGETLILTHDHWAPLTPNLNEVEMRDAQGALLLTLDAATFRSLLIYRDGGTLMLRLPEGLKGLVAATTGAPSVEGDVVWFARRDAGTGRTTVEVIAGSVTSVDGKGSPASIRLRNLDGSAVIPGDSGGGVWADGKLLGNVWAAGMKENRSLWATLFGAGDSGQPSDLTIAALQPLHGGPELAMGAAAAEVADHMGGYVREP